jgi:3-oxoacyl-[acyl-carrier-protein] synthase-1
VSATHDIRIRLSAIALSALREVTRQAAADSLRRRSVPLFLGIPSTRPGLSVEDIQYVAGVIEATLHDAAISVSVHLVGGGHAAGLLALRAGCNAVAHGESPFAVVGAVDSWVHPETLEWLEAEERLHNAVNPWGFIPGEAAAFCLIMSAAHVPAQSDRSWLRPIGFGVATEPIPRRGAEPCLGRGLTTAIEGAIASLDLSLRVDEVFCDYNGEVDRADEYGFAVVRTGGRFIDATATRTPADCWGDVGAATGSLLIALVSEAAARAWLRGPNVLIWSSSDEPSRAAVLVQGLT